MLNLRLHVRVVMMILVALCLCTAPRAHAEASDPKPDANGHITIEQEIELGNGVAAKVRKQFGGDWNNPQQLARVRKIAWRLFNVCDRHEVPAFRRNFSVELLNTDVANALCVPGGHTFVTRGLLQLGLRDDELACVMGHEIAHAARRHGARNLETAYLLEAKIDATTKREIFRKLARAGVLLFLFKKFTPDLEYEADYYGEIYAYRAGYDPYGMVTLFERIEKTESGSFLKRMLSSLFDNHPPTPDRIARAKREAERLKAGETVETTPIPVYQ